MKKFSYIVLGVLLLIGANCKAQTENPDQNPNYQTSEKKYIEQSEELTKTQSTTIQETYEAYDWTENKAKQKEERKDRRFEKRKIRYQSRRICRPGYYNGWYSGNGYYNNNFNNGYNNNFNNGYYNNYVPNYNPSNLYNSILLGAGLYYLFN